VYGTVQGVFAMVRPGRRWLLLAALAALAGGLVAAAARGPDGGAEQVARELRRTDALIERAREEVAATRGRYAREQLERAIDAQAQARRHFEGSNPNIVAAARQTRAARRLALRAIEAARVERRAQESVGGRIERAEQRLAEVAIAVRAAREPLARRLLDQGADHLRRARRAWRESDARAVRLADLALHLIERAGSIAAGQAAAAGAAETSVERTALLLAEVDERLEAEGAGPDLVARQGTARGLLERARGALRDGAPTQALRLSLEAREIGLAVLAGLERAPDVVGLREMLEDLEAVHAETAGAIEAGGVPEARRLLARSGALLEEARGHVEAGRVREAVAALAAAEASLREAADAAGVR
jgi:hypothetical protein